MAIFRYDPNLRKVYISELALVQLIREWDRQNKCPAIHYLSGQRSLARHIIAAMVDEPIQDMKSTTKRHYDFGVELCNAFKK